MCFVGAEDVGSQGETKGWGVGTPGGARCGGGGCIIFAGGDFLLGGGDGLLVIFSLRPLVGARV